MDPVAALRCWPVEVDLGDSSYLIPAAPAGTWVTAILAHDLTAVIPRMFADADAETEVVTALLTGELTEEELETAAQDAIAAAGGDTWWVVARLITPLRSPQVLGEVVATGFDFDRQPLAALCALVYAIHVRNLDEKAFTKFDQELRQAPIRHLASQPEEDTGLDQAFLAAIAEQQARSGTGPAADQ